MLFERTAWAAMARLALGDVSGARALVEKGARNPDQLDPQPATANMLFLTAQALRLDGDLQASIEIETSAAKLVERAQAEGWDDVAFANYDPVMAEMEW